MSNDLKGPKRTSQTQSNRRSVFTLTCRPMSSPLPPGESAPFGLKSKHQLKCIQREQATQLKDRRKRTTQTPFKIVRTFRPISSPWTPP